MFSERVYNWAKMFELFTGTMKAIAIGLILETDALRSTQPQARSYRTSVHQSAPETQREWAMVNARIFRLRAMAA
jgi:cytolysin (calcineurin-like family phosphatase)